MIKAFLSHSSKDKANYVRIVADRLKNKMNIVYDEYTFEAGNKTFNEIITKWVQEEVLIASNSFKNNTKQLFPIIIDKNITYKDARIPDWMKEEYNLQYVSKPTISAKRIESKLREISLLKHIKLNQKYNLCIGRNNILDEFEERIDDFESDKPKCIISTGVLSIGRRTFLKHALEKTDIIDKYYTPNSIYLNTNDSIEDFILKLNDYGFIDIDSDIKNLLNKTQEYKIELAIKILKEIQNNKELFIILDNGCIVNYERVISSWFKKIIESPELLNQPIICTASKYRVNYKDVRTDSFYAIGVSDLTMSERKRLFSRLLKIENIDMSKEDFSLISGQFYGLPEQILFCVDYIKRTNVQHVKNHLHEIREYNDEKASMLIKHYSENEEVLSFIRLIAQFEIISLDFLYQIVENTKFSVILDILVTENICEYFGYDGQFIRLNDSIRDYIVRNKTKIRQEYLERIQDHVEDFIKSDDFSDKDSSDYLFSIKEAILTEKEINDNLLFPSHFLRTMKDLYYERKYSRVIELADKVLDKEDFIDKNLVNDIRYYLCLALAKKKDKRVLQEVQKLGGDEHNFVLGYYYRIVGRYTDAIERLNKVVNSRYIQSRAKRELVHIYIQTEGYSKALEYARTNYIENKNNIYHIQLYFTCLISNEKFADYKEEIEGIVLELEERSLENNQDMGVRARALFLAKYEHDETNALNKINDAISSFPNSHYPLLTKFDIASFFKNISAMKEALDELEKFNKRISSRTFIKQKAYFTAISGNSVKAKQIINDELKNYPEEARNFILNNLDKLSKKNFHK